MNKTNIEWVKNLDGSQGYTWNPITGCLNNCSYCYARKLAEGRLRSRYLNNCHVIEFYSTNIKAQQDPFYPRFWPERLGQLYWDEAPYHKIKRCKPRGIFVCDMSDLFGIGVPEDWTCKVLKEIENKAWWETGDRFYLLTKQPQNLIKFSPFPDNCWVGVTATDEDMLRVAITHLAKIEAKVKYLSFEPLLGWGDFYKTALSGWLTLVDWVIIGAQTKPYKPPKWEWVSEIIDACVEADIPYFLKNNLEPVVPKVFGGNGALIQDMPGLLCKTG